MTIRWRLLENIRGIEAGLAKIRRKASRCVECEKCRLLWYLASAIKIGDPYKTVEINRLLKKMNLNVASSTDVGGYITESLAWIGTGDWSVDATGETSAAKLIRKWKLHLLMPSDLDALRTTAAKFPWMLEVVRASVLEMKGDYDTAVQYYRRAYKLMPRWLPEAKVVYEKLNELGHSVA